MSRKRGRKNKQSTVRKQDQFFDIKPSKRINGVRVLSEAEIVHEYGIEFLKTLNHWS